MPALRSLVGYWLAAALYLVVVADLTPFQLVLIGTFQGITVVIAEVPAGVLADAVSRRLSLVIGHIVMGAGMALAGLVTVFPLLVISQCLWGLGWAFSSGADVAWITDELDQPDVIDRVLVAQARWDLVGTAIGLASFGTLAWVSTLSTAIVVAGVAMALLGILVVARWSETGFTPADAGRRWHQSMAILRGGLTLARADRVVLVIIVATLLVNGSGEAYGRLLQLRLVELGVPVHPDPIVWFAALSLVGVALGAVVLRFVEARIAGTGVAKRTYVLSCAVGVVGLVLFATAPNTATAVVGSLLVTGIAYPVIRTTGVIWVNRRTTSAVRATVHSLLSQAEHAGEIVFGLVLAVLAGAASVTAALAGSAVILAVAGTLVAADQRRRSFGRDHGWPWETAAMKLGPVRYARNGSVRLAYRVLGEANRPLVWVPGWVSNVDEYDDPVHPFTALAERLTPSTRLIVWDKRGTGLSDPVDAVPSMDDRMDDLRAVMDAADVEEAALFGASEGGPMSLLFAATYPERVRSLVLYGSAARFSADPPSYPWGFTRAEIDAQLRDIDDHWGQGALVELFMSSIAEVEGVRSLFGRAQRRGASPTMAKRLWQALMEIDVRDVLGSVEAPTLVIHHAEGDRVVSVDAARDLAARLPNGSFRELPAGDHLAFDFGEAMSDAIREFVVDEHDDAVSVDRTLATIMFTDIVGSTEAVSEQGDERWRRQLDLHEQLIDRHVGAAGGQKVKDTGDGVFAVFDGPTKGAHCALELVAAMATHGLSIRAGVHTGECERRGNDWSGLGVHVGARVAALAEAGEVLVSRTVRDLSAGSGLGFEERGTHVLKGVAEPWELFRVTSRGA